MIFWVVRVKVIHGEYLMGRYPASFYSHLSILEERKLVEQNILLKDDGPCNLTLTMPSLYSDVLRFQCKESDLPLLVWQKAYPSFFLYHTYGV